MSVRQDPRNIKWGYEIPKEHYCDQPYVVITKEGHWLCVLTTGVGVEGEQGQHVVSTISADQGRTWSPLTDIEPADGPEASWVMPLIVPSGRIYAFYTYNGDNLREVIADRDGYRKRVDTLGQLMFKYSDDHGRNWSAERYPVPIRMMKIDRDNPYGGEIQFFWGVGKPIVHEGAVYMGLAKVGSFGEGFMASSEGIVMKSVNIWSEADPANIEWETLPDGDAGIRAPRGPVADEHNVTGLSDGSLYCTYRTIEGYNAQAYSRDGGHTWTPPQYAEYSPGGRRIKHPRAANFVRKFSNGNYLLWFHNHGRDWRDAPARAYKDRNPAWLCGGVEKDGHIYWSQPEIVLYDDDPHVRISYPDFIEDNGRYFITETQKTIARVHEIDPALLEGLWNQHRNRTRTDDGLALYIPGALAAEERRLSLPELPSLLEGGGFTLELQIYLTKLNESRVLLDTRTADGQGIVLTAIGRGALELRLHDGRNAACWESDAGALECGRRHHVGVVVDGGPKLILFYIDGRLNDGGEERQFGFGRFSPYMQNINGIKELSVSPLPGASVFDLRLYTRALRTSELAGNWRAASESAEAKP